MANDVTRNPWIIDTASATALIAAGTEVKIRNITWVDPGASAADEAVVADGSGRIIWRRVAAGANNYSAEEFHGIRGRTIDGLQVPTLAAGGTLYITFHQDGGS